MLEIKGLNASIADGGQAILKGVDLKVAPGEVHAIMGPNGAGKSTLGYVLAGREDYDVTAGSVALDGADMLEMDIAERALSGLFLAFQYPVELPGVNVAQFLRTVMNAQRKERGENELNAAQFLKLCRAEMATLGMKEDFLQRSVNVGFSGGEKKRLEILQMALLQPKYAVLDETDSGLDIDALKIVAEGVNRLREGGDKGFVIITHYQRLLDHIKPDFVHIFADGAIKMSGDFSLAEKLETLGYEGLLAA